MDKHSSLIFPDSVPHIFDRGVGGQLGDIASPGFSFLQVESPGFSLRFLEWDSSILARTPSKSHLVV